MVCYTYICFPGLYYNKYRWLEMLSKRERLFNQQVKIKGDVVLVKPFLLVKGG